jgi:hypothetical protein
MPPMPMHARVACCFSHNSNIIVPTISYGQEFVEWRRRCNGSRQNKASVRSMTKKMYWRTAAGERTTYVEGQGRRVKYSLSLSSVTPSPFLGCSFGQKFSLFSPPK